MLVFRNGPGIKAVVLTLRSQDMIALETNLDQQVKHSVLLGWIIVFKAQIFLTIFFYHRFRIVNGKAKSLKNAVTIINCFIANQSFKKTGVI